MWKQIFNVVMNSLVFWYNIDHNVFYIFDLLQDIEILQENQIKIAAFLLHTVLLSLWNTQTTWNKSTLYVQPKEHMA